MNLNYHNAHCRLYDAFSGSDLILDGCSVQALIADVHASVTLSQRFTNPSLSRNKISAVYTFGLMARAAVCGFEMIRGNGAKVEGIVKEKEAAKREYEEAVKAGHTASLGRQETGDVFSITVGNILPSETVTINIRYIQLLMDDEKNDQIKFIFPRAYTERYGVAPALNSAVASKIHWSCKMNVVVQQAGAIKSISCPSGHSISFELSIPNNLAETELSHSARVSISIANAEWYFGDVVLVISAESLDSPRCFIEPHPSPFHETTALALTFVPQFNLPDLPGGMEYIFLVDRSGSMQGERMRLVREALVVLLRGLPMNGTTFNIFSFGSHATNLWKQSRAYSQATLGEATSHVDSMEANYGGTEIASALEVVYDSLTERLTRPAAVFLLTDGSAWDVSTCVQHTLAARAAKASSANFLRVFAVGIGDGASTDTCESIARAGGGAAVYVKQGEAMTGKCSRLVRAARTPEVRVQVAWGVSEPESSKESDDDDFEMVESSLAPGAIPVNLFDNESHIQLPTGPPPKPNPILPPQPLVQQSPLVIPSIFPGTRTQVYAIIQTPRSDKSSVAIQEIKVKGIVTATGDPVELVVPLSKMASSLSSAGWSTSKNLFFGFLHALAAQSLIKDREEGKHCFPSSVSAFLDERSADSDYVRETKSELRSAYLEKDIIRLGMEYNLASRFTSFIAVDRSNHRNLGYQQEQRIGTNTSVGSSTGGSSSIYPAQAAQMSLAGLRANAPPPAARRGRPAEHHATTDEVPTAHIAGKLGAALPSMHPPSSTGPPAPYPNLVVAFEQHMQLCMATNKTDEVELEEVCELEEMYELEEVCESIEASSTPGPLLAAVARLQQAYGGFLLSETLLSLLKRLLVFKDQFQSSEDIFRKLCGFPDQDLCATTLAVIWMERWMKKYGEDALDMKEKAETWAREETGGTEPFDRLRAEVIKMLRE